MRYAAREGYAPGSDPDDDKRRVLTRLRLDLPYQCFQALAERLAVDPLEPVFRRVGHFTRRLS